MSDASSSPNSKPSSIANAWAHRLFWEQCERRLAMSATPWMPWEMGPHELFDTSNALGGANAASYDTGIPPTVDTQPLPNIETHLSEAHSQTGWNQIHSQYGLSGKGQTVAVIDSGIAFDHVALGKGYGAGYRVVGGWDFAENDARPYDDAPAGFHGTHVAGIIGANDGVHYGVSPDVDLVALRVFNDTGKGELSWAESALKWVHDNRNAFENPITTVNLSLGAAWNSSTVPNWATLEEELGQLQSDGIVVVVSAGNSFQQYKTSGLSYPAASPFVIPVSSIDANGQLSDFSQRDARSIAAPGRSIESTVPDYFYGKDGIANDWATASGTSMASPYIAGASVLVREAMEMVGLQNITPQSIYEQLRSTAQSVWDNVTQQNYMSLDLDRAIESILPKDLVGDSLSTGLATTIQSSWQSDGWINTLTDADAFRLNPTQSGTISVQLTSEYVDSPVFELLRGNSEQLVQAAQGRLTFSVLAGESIGLSVGELDSIGPYRLNWTFTPLSTNGESGGGGTVAPTPISNLGSVDFLEQSLSGSSRYKVTAAHSGIYSVVVDAGQQPTGTLQVSRPGFSGSPITDTTLENNQWRIDLNVTQGQELEFVLPGTASRNVHLVNLVQQNGSQLNIFGSDAADRVSIDLSSGIAANVGGVVYKYESNSVNAIQLDGGLNNDSLSVFGTASAEKVELRPGVASVSNSLVTIQANNFESVQFVGSGGPDRAYLYDAATDDRLNVWPNKAELTGVGYAFSVDQVERIFVHAVQGGDDQAFVFDSVGNDALSVRPQFTSLSGAGYFNYVSGFERVFAYANAGGIDNAQLYDSQGNDLFSSSGEVTSIVGPGFSTFARGFENTEAYSTAGGTDRALIYASSSGKLTAGADFVGMQEATRSSLARNFEQIQTFLAGAPVPTPAYVASLSALSEIAAVDLSDNSQQTPSPAMANPAMASPAMANPAMASPAMETAAMQVHDVAPKIQDWATEFDLARGNASVLDNVDAGGYLNAMEGRIDWLADWVDSELQRRKTGIAYPGVHRELENGLADLDLSWTEQAKEREILDAIFEKH